MKIEHLYAAVVGILTLLAATYIILSAASVSEASSPTFVRISATGGAGAFASSSLIYMSAGTATTSLSFDAYAAQGTGEVNGQMTFTLNTQMTASSTATQYCRVIEISNDGVDFYPISATSSATIGTGYNSQCWNSSSSTLDLSGGTTGRFGQSAQIPILARYTKVIFYIPVGSQSGALWAETLGVKQRI